METMQPILKSGRTAWDRINMPVEEFHERVKRIRKGDQKGGDRSSSALWDRV